jgi:hypothetical protein
MTARIADDSPAAWRGAGLGTDWILPLDAGQREELHAALVALRTDALPLAQITRSTLELPRTVPLLRAIRERLHRGCGFALLRGVPVEGFAAEDIARLYWLLGRHLGDPVPQNHEGEYLCAVRDTGADPGNRETRLYTTRAEQDFHTDGADIIGLICLQGARRGGASRLVSSVRVYLEVERARPDLAPLLFEPWHWHLPNPRGTPGAPQGFSFPICRREGGGLATFFIAWYIRRAADLPGVPLLTVQQEELLALYERTANDPANYLDMDFLPGDVQWLKNSVILHKRTAYEDWDEPQRKRHLLRLWLAAADFADGDPVLRHGFATAPAGEPRAR